MGVWPMKKEPKPAQQLLDPEHALRAYLEALLNEVPDELPDEEPDERPAAAVSAPAETVTRIAPGPARRPQVVVAQVVTPAPVAPAVTAPQPVPVKVAETAPVSSPDLPDWTRNEFQALSFKVAGITLATPLLRLGGIIELSEEMTILPGYSSWVMGVLVNRGQQVQVVDLAQIILPEGHAAPMEPARQRARYVLLVNDGKFGLAADNLEQILTLRPDDVRWRTSLGKRPWLAGMVIQQMCAVLDIDCLTRQFASGMRPGAGGV